VCHRTRVSCVPARNPSLGPRSRRRSSPHRLGIHRRGCAIGDPLSVGARGRQS
jgi:hypothetical protein